MLIAFVGDKLAYAYRLSEGNDVLKRLMDTIKSLKVQYLVFYIKDILAGINISIIVRDIKKLTISVKKYVKWLKGVYCL